MFKRNVKWGINDVIRRSLLELSISKGELWNLSFCRDFLKSRRQSKLIPQNLDESLCHYPFEKREVKIIQVQKNYTYWFLLQKYRNTILLKELAVNFVVKSMNCCQTTKILCCILSSVMAFVLLGISQLLPQFSLLVRTTERCLCLFIYIQIMYHHEGHIAKHRAHALVYKWYHCTIYSLNITCWHYFPFFKEIDIFMLTVPFTVHFVRLLTLLQICL